jgi:hypothetical protein
MKRLTQDNIASQYKGLRHRREIKMRLRAAHKIMLKTAKRERWSAKRLEATLTALPKEVLDEFRRDHYRSKRRERSSE